MEKILSALLVCFFVCSFSVYAQAFKLDTTTLEAVNISMATEKLKGRKTIKVIKSSAIIETDEPTFVKTNGVNFKNGTIEVAVLSRLLPDAPELARGFIGIAFRINDSNSTFECLYIRPTNGRATSQLRRNRAIQYFSYPHYKFERLRKEAPGEYETYADIGLNEWIKLKIVVKDSQATLFINDTKQPALIVNDLKGGAAASGGVGLWVDVGTEGFFSQLKIQKE